MHARWHERHVSYGTTAAPCRFAAQHQHNVARVWKTNNFTFDAARNADCAGTRARPQHALSIDHYVLVLVKRVRVCVLVCTT